MLDVPGRLPHFHCALQRPAAHKHAHRQHTPRGEGTQLGRWAVGGGRHAPVFKPWRSSRCGPSEFESIGSMRTSSHQQHAGGRRATSGGHPPHAARIAARAVRRVARVKTGSGGCAGGVSGSRRGLVSHTDGQSRMVWRHVERASQYSSATHTFSHTFVASQAKSRVSITGDCG